MRLLTAIALIVSTLSTIVYYFLVYDKHIDYRIKLIDLMMQTYFAACGVTVPYIGFSRKCLNYLEKKEPLTAFNSTRGVRTLDYKIPFGVPLSVYQDEKIKPHDVHIRLFEPNQTKKQHCQDDKLPVMILIHGGGFALGSAFSRSYDELGGFFAARAHIKVISVEYRLAPEYPFPSSIYDCWSVYSWLVSTYNKNINIDDPEVASFLKNIDYDRILVGGDSAGAGLSAALALTSATGLIYDKHLDRLPALAKPIQYQILIYPPSTSDQTESKIKNSRGYILNDKMIKFFTDAYVGDSGVDDEKHHQRGYFNVASLSNQKGVPDAMVITATFDPLLDDGRILAERLNQTGADVVYREYSSIHGFYTMTFLDVAQEAREFTIDTMREKRVVGDIKCYTSN
ncbi:carboxylesterase [Acrasis kona]|uniref:Carboxylesterase n=1 Tax=Acrasis kona TaxID=1008807 RepID=A0AAW2Z3D1_9EUKA